MLALSGGCVAAEKGEEWSGRPGVGTGIVAGWSKLAAAPGAGPEPQSLLQAATACRLSGELSVLGNRIEDSS